VGGPAIRPGIDAIRSGIDEFRPLVGLAVRPAVADLLFGISVGPIAEFSASTTSFNLRSKPDTGTPEDWRLVRATLGRIMGSGLVFGLSRVTARGDKVGLNGTTSIDK
jgi:hypothetical protein